MRGIAVNKKHRQPPTRLEEIAIEVQGHDGEKYRAILWPVHLSSTCVSATMEWNGDMSELYVIKGQSDYLTAYGQRLLLVYLAASDDSSPGFDSWCAGKWTAAKLSLQSLLGEPGQVIHIRLSSEDALATLEVDGEPVRGDSQTIPPNLVSGPVGLALVEMTSRMLLGHTWQTQELIPLQRRT
jgi:hypothetical protein